MDKVIKIENKLFRTWGKYTKKMYNVTGMHWSNDNIISEICIDTGNERVYRDATNYIIMLKIIKISLSIK